MNVINTYSNKRFTFNGAQYLKNYISKISGNRLIVFNCYDNKDVLCEFDIYSNYIIDGVTYGNVNDLQAAIIDVIYSRGTLGNDIDEIVLDNINIVKDVVVSPGASETDILTAINSLPMYVVADVNILYFKVTDGADLNNIYVLKDAGKGIYGSGGTALTLSNLFLIDSYQAGTDQNNIHKIKSYVLPGTTDVILTPAEVAALINSNEPVVFGEKDVPYIAVIRTGINTKDFYFLRTGKGTYGFGQTPVTASSLIYFSRTGATAQEIIEGGNTVTFNLGEVADGDYITVLNSVERDLTDDTLVYFVVYTYMGDTYNKYFVGTTYGLYGGANPNMFVLADWLDVTGSTSPEVITAGTVTYDPTGNAIITGTNVQDALDQTDSALKLARSGGIPVLNDYVTFTASTANFTVLPGSGSIFNPAVGATGTYYPVTWTGGNFTITNPAIQQTYIYVDTSGNIGQQTTPITTEDICSKIFLTRLTTNGTNIITNNRLQIKTTGLAQEIFLIADDNKFKKTGYSVTGNANLTINVASGKMKIPGGGNTPYDNHNVYHDATATPNIFLYTRTGPSYGSSTSVPVNVYDVGGVQTAIPNNRWVVMPLRKYQGGTYTLQLGQQLHNSLADAVAAADSGQSYIINPGLTEGAAIAYIIVSNATTNLSTSVNSAIRNIADTQRTTTALSIASTVSEGSLDPVQGGGVYTYGQTINKGTATGTNTYAVTLANGVSSYVDGAVYRVKFTNANTGASTLNVNTLGAKTISLAGSALSSGDIEANRWYRLVYNSTTDELRLLDSNKAPNQAPMTSNKTIANTAYVDAAVAALNNNITYVRTYSTPIVMPAVATSETIITSIPLPTGMFINGRWDLNAVYTTDDTANQKTFKVYINTTSGTLSGATQIATTILLAGNKYLGLKRTFTIQGGSLKGFQFTFSNTSDEVSSAAGWSTSAINNANTYYLILTSAVNTTPAELTLQNVYYNYYKE